MTLDEFKDKIGIGDDKVYGVMGAFTNPDDLVEAGRKIREMGYTKLDAMSPFPVHGIDDAIGVPPSKLGWLVIWFSALGCATAITLIWYVGAINYPAGDRRQAVLRLFLYDSDCVRADGIVLGIRQFPRACGRLMGCRGCIIHHSIIRKRTGPPTICSCWSSRPRIRSSMHKNASSICAASAPVTWR